MDMQYDAERRSHTKQNGVRAQKTFRLEEGEQAWMKLLQLRFRKLLVKTASH